MSAQLWWDVARAGGLLSWALLAASVLWGLALSSRIFGRRPRPAWLLDVHRYLGGLAVIFVGVHVVAIMLDTYVSFGPAQAFLPFASTWHPVAVAWGVVALYLLLAVELTSLARRHLPLRIWRRFHYLSFGVFVFSTVHLLTAGTDRTNPVVVLPVIAVCGAVLVLTALRNAPQPPQPTAPRAAPAPRARRPVGPTVTPPPRRRAPGARTPSLTGR
ncbi:MAG TPA: ferric reductase-like transmembrane domain-containing protein [Acidimicrobiia bacterium]|nr:ferric reductase-like transmembrane domain-containing protein [Acidimicrobiia bacterium]